MSLIERNISEQADTVTRKLLDGQPVDQAEAVGLAQEIVRLSTKLAGAVALLAELGRYADSAPADANVRVSVPMRLLRAARDIGAE